MARWSAQPIYIYFNDKFDTGEENCLPYNPDRFMFHIAGNNETMDMLTIGEISIVKKAKLIEYEPIESFFTHRDRPRLMRVKESQDWLPNQWVNFFKSAMEKAKVLEMTITGINYVELVTVEDFQYGKLAGREMETSYTLQLKQYREGEIKQETINIKQEVPPTNLSGENGSEKVEVQAKKTSNSGATLWLCGRAWNTVNESNIMEDPIMYGKKQADFRWLPVKKTLNLSERRCSLEYTEKGNKVLNEVKNGDWLVDWRMVENALRKFGVSTIQSIKDAYHGFYKLRYSIEPSLTNSITYDDFRLFVLSIYESKIGDIIDKAFRSKFLEKNSNDAYSYYLYYRNTLRVTSFDGLSQQSNIEEEIAQVEVINSNYTRESQNMKKSGTPNGNSITTDYFEKGKKLWCYNVDLKEENKDNVPFTVGAWTNG